MKSRMKKTPYIAKAAIMFAALACAALSASLAQPVYANSGSPWSEGVDSMGVRTLYTEGVLEVESENLTFNINNGPGDLEEDELYDATVTAEYSFYNPTDETLTTTFVFPYGNKPSGYRVENEKEIVNPVTVNGEAVKCEQRYVYGNYYNFYELVEKIKDDYTETDFYKRDTSVYEYKITAAPRDEAMNADYLYLIAPVSADSSKTRFIALSDDDDELQLYVSDDNSMETTLYLIGEDCDVSSLAWTGERYVDSGKYGNYQTDIPVTVTVSEKTEMTLEEYFLSMRGEATEVSNMDWWNICIDAISVADNNLVISSGHTPKGEYLEYKCCSLYTYQYTAGPGERFINTVTAPLYPEINNRYDCGYYEYTYYLSPAKSWASFKNLTVNINTEMYLKSAYADESIDYEKTETGYTFSFETLPENELHFSLSTEENPTYDNSYGIAWVLLLLILALPFILILAAAIIIPIVLIVLLKKKKKNDKPPYPHYRPYGAPGNCGGGNPSGGNVNAAEKDTNPDVSNSEGEETDGEKPQED